MLKQFKAILKKEGFRSKDFCERLGIRYGSYRSMTRKNAGSVPKWVSAFVLGYSLAKKSQDKSKTEYK